MKRESGVRQVGSGGARRASDRTAPDPSAAIGEPDYRSWLGALPSGAQTSLYIHMPFCRSTCLLGGCDATVTTREAPIARYLQAVEREVELVAQAVSAALRIRHAHVGGSPTLMRPPQMLELMDLVRRHFTFAAETEVAVEIDPRTLGAEMAAALGGAGFNRASICVHSFDPAVQRAVDRARSFEETEAAIASLRNAGVRRIHLDLAYGLPKQSVRACLDTVDRALALQPDGFAVFGYAHIPDFECRQRRIDAAALPSTSTQLEQLGLIAGALTDAGYVAIGRDHFARPDDPLAIALRSGRLRRNFQGYTTEPVEVQIGFGASSIGRLPSGYVQNVVLVPDYQQLVAAGRLPVERGYAIRPEERVRGAIVERIMCDRSVDPKAVFASFGSSPW